MDYTQTLNSSINTPKGPPAHNLSLWQKPLPSFMKLNYDATCNIETQRLRFGAIVCDVNGMVMGSLCCSRAFHPDPFTIKDIALVTIFKFCKDVGLSHIVVEGDALRVVKLLRDNIEDWSQGDVLVAGAKAILNSFANWSTTHVRRNANQTTHLLAKEAVNSEVNSYVLEQVPQCIKHVVGKECLNVTWQSNRMNIFTIKNKNKTFSP